MNLTEMIVVLCIATLLTFISVPAGWVLISLASRFGI